MVNRLTKTTLVIKKGSCNDRSWFIVYKKENRFWYFTPQANEAIPSHIGHLKEHKLPPHEKCPCENPRAFHDFPFHLQYYHLQKTWANRWKHNLSRTRILTVIWQGNLVLPTDFSTRYYRATHFIPGSLHTRNHWIFDTASDFHVSLLNLCISLTLQTLQYKGHSVCFTDFRRPKTNQFYK